MLRVAALELGHPMVIRVAMETGDPPLRRAYVIVCAHALKVAENERAPPRARLLFCYDAISELDQAVRASTSTFGRDRYHCMVASRP